jgi:hypothetical protein
MPNTLAHLGVQGLATRTLIRDADPKWIFVGCIIPDVSWILQRAVWLALPGFDPYDLRLYVMVQASFFFCLILSWALATLSAHFWKTFVILALNSLLHLLLDASQIKWAGGVHLLAPVDWNLTSFGFFWPEGFPTYLLTAFGLAYFVASWRRGIMTPADLTLRSPIRYFGIIALIAAYVALPFLLLEGPEQADSHFVKTLRHRRDRPGRYVEFDRVSYYRRSQGGVLRTFANEELGVEKLAVGRSATVSVRGTFVTEDSVRVSEHHVHITRVRNGASYLGLILVVVLWICALTRRKLLIYKDRSIA